MPDFRYCLSVAACTVLLLGFWSIYFYYRKCKKALSSEAFDGRTIIITGASSGLGRALAIELFNAATGAQLVLASRDLDSLKNLVLQLQNDDKKKLAPIVYRLDLEDNESVAKFAQDFLRDFPHGVDILINNAGVSIRGDCFSTSMEIHRRLMQVNYFGHIDLISRLFSEYWNNPKKLVTKRVIVAVSSVQGRLAVPYSDQSMSEHGLEFVEEISQICT